MALAVADLEKPKRGDPDYPRLRAMVANGATRKGISLRQLGLTIGFSHSVVTEFMRHDKKPQREVLIALADYFDESREDWQEAGGFDISDLPPGRGYTTEERTLARWLSSLSPEDREAVRQELQQERPRLWVVPPSGKLESR